MSALKFKHRKDHQENENVLNWSLYSSFPHSLFQQRNSTEEETSYMKRDELGQQLMAAYLKLGSHKKV